MKRVVWAETIQTHCFCSLVFCLFWPSRSDILGFRGQRLLELVWEGGSFNCRILGKDFRDFIAKWQVPFFNGCFVWVGGLGLVKRCWRLFLGFFVP